MTTIIRLNNANFNNPGLPVIPRIVPGDIGFAVKPSINNGFVDFTGNATVSSVEGTPILNETSVTCGAVDGYKMSTTDESANLTSAVVLTGNPTSNYMPIGCYDTDTATGWGLWFSGNNINVNVFNNSGTLVSFRNADVFPDDTSVFACVTISDDLITLYYSSGGALVAVTQSGSFSDRARDETVNIGVGAAPISTWPGLSLPIHSASYHSRALSSDEVQKLYEYEKAYQSAVNGVSI